MTKILNFGLKIKGVVGKVAHAKSFYTATPPPQKKRKLKRAQEVCTVCLVAME